MGDGVRRLRSHSARATEALAEELGRALTPDSVVALDGELGAGKTCFVRGLARGLGVTDPVNSPTYTLMHQYSGRLTLYHFDAWMEGREAALLEDGGDAWFRAGGVAVVEWASRVADWLPQPYLGIELSHAGPDERGITLRVVGEPAAALVDLALGLQLPDGVQEER